MNNNKSIKLYIPRYPKIIIDTLKANGYDAYIVGGCVRDQLLNIIPSDYDITTNARPQEVKKLFKKTIDTGVKHGTVSVLFYESGKPIFYEVTTYRVDGEYDDARHPRNVLFVNDLKEDLRRRDFTVNAMAYNEAAGLIDEFGGASDLKDKLVRAVGNPNERFSEDALRLLRAIRFAAKLGFDIESETAKAIPTLASNLVNVSKERIQVELSKILTSDNPTYIKKIYEFGLAKYICDGFQNIRVGKFVKKLPIHIAYACLFYHTDEKVAVGMLKNLRFDNINIMKVQCMLSAKKYYKKLFEIWKKNNSEEELGAVIKECIDYLKYELMSDFLRMIEINEGNNKLLSIIKSKVNRYKESKVPIFISDLNISGDELLDIGYKGAEVGAALRNLQKIVHIKPSCNEKKLLQVLAKKAYNVYRENQKVNAI